MPRHAAASPDHAATAPVPTRPRQDGWTAERQRAFLTGLAETGSITQA